jgi:hypothetical protein
VTAFHPFPLFAQSRDIVVFFFSPSLVWKYFIIFMVMGVPPGHESFFVIRTLSTPFL